MKYWRIWANLHGNVSVRDFHSAENADLSNLRNHEHHFHVQKIQPFIHELTQGVEMLAIAGQI
jgi:hypothetical protein